jgi:hypothetical protein
MATIPVTYGDVYTAMFSVRCGGDCVAFKQVMIGEVYSHYTSQIFRQKYGHNTSHLWRPQKAIILIRCGGAYMAIIAVTNGSIYVATFQPRMLATIWLLHLSRMEVAI